jgi:hypothetical protein
MEASRRRQLIQALIALVRPPPNFHEYQKFVVKLLLQIVQLPAEHTLSVQQRLFGEYDVECTGRNVFTLFSDHRYEFFEVTGEGPETFLELVNILPLREYGDNILTKRNRVLLVVIWLRTYQTYRMLSVLFDVSVSYIEDELKRSIPIFEEVMSQFITWPSEQEWLDLRGNWPKISAAVGAIDGTSHEIYRPTEFQHQFYSGHRRYHCLHTQLVIDNSGRIRYLESGFLGHQNDAQQFILMRQIGVELPFPDVCFLLGDTIYPNRYPLLTPYSMAQIRRKHGVERQQSLRFNRYLRRYRVKVEHTIAQMKIYKSISSVWRHPRNLLSNVVKICAGLICRRKDLGLLL